jgi:hypothetical protein
LARPTARSHAALRGRTTRAAREKTIRVGNYFQLPDLVPRLGGDRCPSCGAVGRKIVPMPHRRQTHREQDACRERQRWHPAGSFSRRRMFVETCAGGGAWRRPFARYIGRSSQKWQRASIEHTRLYGEIVVADAFSRRRIRPPRGDVGCNAAGHNRLPPLNPNFAAHRIESQCARCSGHLPRRRTV